MGPVRAGEGLNQLYSIKLIVYGRVGLWQADDTTRHAPPVIEACLLGLAPSMRSEDLSIRRTTISSASQSDGPCSRIDISRRPAGSFASGPRPRASARARAPRAPRFADRREGGGELPRLLCARGRAGFAGVARAVRGLSPADGPRRNGLSSAPKAIWNQPTARRGSTLSRISAPGRRSVPGRAAPR